MSAKRYLYDGSLTADRNDRQSIARILSCNFTLYALATYVIPRLSAMGRWYTAHRCFPVVHSKIANGVIIFSLNWSIVQRYLSTALSMWVAEFCFFRNAKYDIRGRSLAMIITWDDCRDEAARTSWLIVRDKEGGTGCPLQTEGSLAKAHTC